MLMHFPPQLPDRMERFYVQYIEDWALCNGLCMRDIDNSHAVHAPVTMFPTPFSKSGFEEALRIQCAFNELYFHAATHEEWLLGHLEEAAKHDDFTAKLIQIHKAAKAGQTQRLTGGLWRSDYIVNGSRTSLEGRQVKQVEFNTVSVSFGALASKVADMHEFLSHASRSWTGHGEVPQNTALKDLARGLANMHAGYKVAEIQHRQATHKTSTSAVEDEDDASIMDDPVVLFIVQPDETNVMDQRLIEFELVKEHDIVSYRISLAEVPDFVVRTNDNRLLHNPSGREIAVVYYRAGYAPSDYPTDVEWNAREMLESSHAVNCPSALTQLAGAKKIQQVLTDRSVLTKIAPSLSSDTVDRLMKTFVKIYPMDDSPEGEQGRYYALREPDHFVLKPQREGGGNNIYGEDIPEFLQSIPTESWAAYILMELIEPPKITNRILRAGKLQSGRVVNELGVFGTVMWDRNHNELLMNEQAGWLLRTKLQDSHEGGVAAGFGCLDSIQLMGPLKDDN